MSWRSRRCGTDADVDDAAGLNHIQPQRPGSLDNFLTVAAGIEPQLAAAARGNFVERLKTDCRRQINANAIELPGGDFGQRAIGRKAFNFSPFGIHRVNGIAHLLMRADRLVPVFRAIGTGAKNCNRRHSFKRLDRRR